MNQRQKGALIVLGGFLGIFNLIGFFSYEHWAFESSNDLPPPGVFYSPNRVDAAWFTIQTLTTTGYGSLPYWPRRLKILSSGLMAGGVIIWTLLLGLAVNHIDRKLLK